MAKLSNFPSEQIFDDNGNPLSYGLVYTYEAGVTDVKKDTFTDKDEGVTNPNPITLDEDGRFGVNELWLGEGAYYIVIRDANEVFVDERDNISGDVSGAFLGTTFTLSSNTIINFPYRNSLISCDGSITLSLLAAADAGDGFSFVVSNTGTGTVTVDPDGTETPITTLGAGDYCFYVCDGTNWQVLYTDNGVFDFDKLQNIAESTILGREDGAGSGEITALSAAQIRTIIDVYTQAEVDAAINNISTGWNYLVSQTTTSGTVFDFTVPSGAQDVEIMFVGVSMSGGDQILVQIGDAGGIEAAGYRTAGMHTSASALGAASYTNGFRFGTSNAAASLQDGSIKLSLADPATFLWTGEGMVSGSSTTITHFSMGSKATSAELTTVRVTRSGSNTFDAGAVYARWK